MNKQHNAAALAVQDIPRADSAEQAVVGSLLLNRDAIEQVDSWLSSRDFFDSACMVVYQAAQDLYRQRIPVDTRTLSEELRKRGKLEAIGGIKFLADVTDTVPTSYHIEYYGKIVLEAAQSRRLIEAGQRVQRLGYETGRSLEERIADSQAALSGIAIEAEKDEPVFLEDLFTEFLEELSNDEPPQMPILTGFYDFDRLLGGLHRGDVTILAARPSVGKSTLAANIGEYVSQHDGPAQTHSLEMPNKQLFYRYITSKLGIPIERLRTKDLATEEITQIIQLASALRPKTTPHEESSMLSFPRLRAKVHKFQAQYEPLSLVIVDYLQLMKADDRYRGQRVYELGEISRGMKMLAREANVPIILISQLTREADKSEHPRLSHLRDSGSIEQDADNVIFLHREDEDSNNVKVIVAKQRNGPTGQFDLYFNKERARYENATYRSVEGYD